MNETEALFLVGGYIIAAAIGIKKCMMSKMYDKAVFNAHSAMSDAADLLTLYHQRMIDEAPAHARRIELARNALLKALIKTRRLMYE